MTEMKRENKAVCVCLDWGGERDRDSYICIYQPELEQRGG